MIGAMTGAESLSATYLQQLAGTGALGATGSLAGGAGAGQSAAGTSPLGLLLSNLQQLQGQDPAKFQQEVSTIAGQLQAAAQQQGQTPAGNFLSNLAAQFQNVASGGSVSQIQPHHGHGHHHHGAQAYAQTQNASASGPLQSLLSSSAPGAGGSSQTAGSSLQQLFTNLASEVSQALAG